MIFRLFGFLFSAMALTLLLGAAAAAGAVWYYGRDLPPTEQLADYKPPQSSLVLNDDGGVIARFAREERVFVAIEDVPDLVKNAFISAEDKNFYNHNGIDPLGIAKAMVRNVQALFEGGRMSGASTITQQVVKNTILTNERSISRKIREAILAMQIDSDLGKDRVLELYLNQIYLGARSYGVGAAARTYFDKPLAYLTAEEAAYLAALPKAPSALHPVRNRATAVARRNYVLEEMNENGYLTAEEATAAEAKPLVTHLGRKKDRNTGETYDWSAAYMIEEVRARMLEWYGERSNLTDTEERSEFSEAALYGDGLRIRTTLDGEMQDYAARALRDGLHNYEKRNGYRGPLGKIPPDENWEQALREAYYPRDLGDWRLGVVLELDEENGVASVGVEGLDELVSVELDAVLWARLRKESGGLGPEVKAISDVFIPGDVVYLAPGDKIADGDIMRVPLEDRKADAEPVWGLRQLPQVNGAVVAIEPATGRVLAMQGGISAQQSVFNRVTQAERQPGSSFKPFIYAAALDHGYTPATIVLDAPVTVDQGNDEGLWKPTNYDEGKFYGPTPLRIGVEKSRNLMTVRIAQDIGMEIVADYARRFGIYEDMPPLLSYSLGAGETTLMQMATAYAIFANGGKRVHPHLIESVLDDAGQPIAIDAPWAVAANPGEVEQVIDPVTAFQTVSIMEGVVLRGTATKLTRLGFPVAGKTGTTNDARDAWFVGFTPDLVFGCYIGYDTPKSLGKRASGGALCGPVFEQFMRDAMLDRTPKKFEAPDGVELIKINRLSGTRVGEDVFGRDVIWEAFRAGTGPDEALSAQGSGDFGGNDFQPSYIPSPQVLNDPTAFPSGGIVYGTTAQPVVVPTAPASSDPNEPLIRFDAATGQWIVAQDPAIRVEGTPGVIYRQTAPAPTTPVNSNNAPASELGNSAQDLEGGRGLY